VSWPWILGIAVGAYAWKAIGLFGLSRVSLSGPLAELVGHLPPALFAGLIAQQTLAAGTTVEVTTRVGGVLAGCVVAWRRGPLLLVITVAAAMTALLRFVAT